MFPHFPLALAKDLEPGGVDDQGNALLLVFGEANDDRFAAAGQGGIVWNVQVKAHETEQ